MGGFPLRPQTVAVLGLVNMLCTIYAQGGSPCGNNEIITISIPEYPNVYPHITIPNGEQSTYRSLLVSRSSDDLILIPSKDNATFDDPSTLFKVEYLPIVPPGYYLTMILGLDRDGPTESADDDRNTLQFTLECKLSGTSGQETYYHVLKIQIQDLNDNAPQFRGGPYSIVVNELTPPGITVYNSISTTDLDNGNNKIAVYSILSAANSQLDGNGIFILPSKDNSYVVIKKQLDYEAMVTQIGDSSLTIYKMNVTVTDTPTEFAPKSNWAYLNITITDGDDLGPVFIYPSCMNSSLKSCISPQYDATIISGTSGTNLAFLPIPRITGNPTQTVVIKARDGDSLNESIRCHIFYTTPSGYKNNFNVTTERIGTTNEYQCNVFLLTPVFRSIVPSLEVVILAIEQTPINKYQEEAIIFITVTPANQFPPQINANSGIFQGYILENSRAGTEIKTTTTLNVPFRLNLTDADLSPGDPLPAYDISLSPATTFTVDSNGYIRLMQEPLDYEVIRNYTFQLKVGETDTAEKKTSSVTLTIFVLNTNDNAPTVLSSLLTKSQPEGDYSTGAGQFLLTISAFDTEDGTNLTYSITDVSPVAGIPKFRVGNNGNVILQGNVVAGEIYTLQIKVSDQGSPTMSTSVTVIVTITTRGNQPPQFTADNYTIYVSEGVPVSSSLWVIPASDPERDPLTYIIVSSVPETNVFDISNLTGNPILRNIQSLDRERIATYTLIMRVQDNALNNDTATVTVIVTDVNDKAPVFSPSSYNFSLQENQASGTTVGTVTATDGDAPNTQFSSITYSLQQPNPDFSIDPHTGIITNNHPFDYETQKVYVFFVLASDQGMDPLVAVCQVTINLLDLPDNVPVFDKPSYTFYVEEQMIANTTVGTITATDLDSLPVVQYQFADSASSDFTINPVTGLIQTKIPLDYNFKSVYTFLVTTKDGSSSNIGLSTATVTLIVQDVNNFTPVINAGPATVTIMETVNLGTVIVDVSATDNDPPNTDNSRITFSIRSVTPSAGEPFFFMNRKSGVVSVAAPLTSTGSDQYTMILRAQDNGKPARSAEATITITILRNHPPVFSNPNITLSTINASQTTIPYNISAINTDIPVSAVRRAVTLSVYLYVCVCIYCVCMYIYM